MPAADTRRYIATVFQGLGNVAAAAPQHSLSALAGEFATRGGLNEQVMAHLKEHGSLGALSDALDSVLRRIRATAV